MNIAIIGSGGAGMTSAWLLDGQHSVTIFERNPSLGGHAHTTVVERDGRVHYADDGFGWFSDVLYPKFMRLLELNQVPLRTVSLAVSFTQQHIQRTLVMPPAGMVEMLRQLMRPLHLRDLLYLERTIRLAAPMVKARDTSLSWAEFLEKIRLPQQFCKEILTPMVVGSWGGPTERALEYSAYAVMKYYVYHRPNLLYRYHWRVIRDGAASYIERVARGLKTCTFRTGTAVRRFIPRAQGWTIEDEHGARHDFDQVIVATGASDAQKILKDTPSLEDVQAALGGFEYYTSRVATHSDPAWMPPDRREWRNANIFTDGQRSGLTIWTDAHGGSHVFTSYAGDRTPRDCHHVSTFRLPLITPKHYHAQAKIAALQGKQKLWFAGDWVHDFGCHEDAVESAYQACRGIDDTLPRLTELSSPCQLPSVQPRVSALSLFRPSST